MNNYSAEELKTLQDSRQSGKSVMTAARYAAMREIIRMYYGKPRTDSLRRFARRILRPKNMRYQSLLRASMRTAWRSKLSKTIEAAVTISDNS